MLIPVQFPPGLDRGASPYDTPNRWYDCNNVRWLDGNIQPLAGNERNTATPLDGPGRGVLVWRDNFSTIQQLVGTDSKLYSATGGAFVDITPTGFVPLGNTGSVPGVFGTGTYGTGTYGNATPALNIFTLFSYWTMDTWGQDAIVCANSDGKLYYYTSSTPTTKPVAISGAVTGNNAVLVTDQRHVMAIGASGDPRKLAWSSSEDVHDWNFASATNTAGFLELNSSAPLLCGVKIREGILVFTQSEVFLVSFVGLPFVYGAQRIADISLLSPKAIATHSGTAEWMGRSGFFQCVGGIVSPLPCPIANDIFNNIDASNGPFRAHAAHNGVTKEVWYFYPETGNTECNRVVIHNYAENWWAWSLMPRSAMAPAGALKTPIACGTDGHVYSHEVGYLDAGSTRVGSVYVESGMIALGKGDRSMEIMQALPANGHGTDSLSLSFYSRQTPEGAERTFGPYLPRSDGYVDTRVSGRDVRMRVAATKDASWSLGPVRLDVESGTGR